MNSTKEKTRPARVPKKKRVVREKNGVYAAKSVNAKNAVKQKRTLELTHELRNGKLYEYYPLGRFVVVAPQIAGAKPIFKYTRVRVKRALDLIADGASIDEAAKKLNSAHIPPEAIREALELARKAFVKAHPPLRRVKRWV